VILQVLVFAAALITVRNFAGVLGFINPRVSPSAASRPVARTLRELTRLAADKKEEDDGGFLKFLKVEQDDAMLSPEEYKQALEAEIEAERKKLYIGGKVKKGNLIVPWKEPDEAELKRDAQEKLRNNGIYDPEGNEEVSEEEQAKVELTLVGGQDVLLKWTAGEPGETLGYIIERKRGQDPNFYELTSYEQQDASQLLVKSFAGAKYDWEDKLVAPGAWAYRVLRKERDGDVIIVDTKDIVVPSAPIIGNLAGSAIAGTIIIVSLIIGSFLAPEQEYK